VSREARRFSYLILAALLLLAPSVVLADQAGFVPGELVIGYAQPADRDRALSNFASLKDAVQIGGSKLREVSAESVSDKAVKLQFKFPESVKSESRPRPEQELGLLQDVARQLKQSDPTIRYAHPNWIAEVR
jgi:hypothetical protein